MRIHERAEALLKEIVRIHDEEADKPAPGGSVVGCVGLPMGGAFTAITAAIRAAVAEEREACIAIVESEPEYPDIDPSNEDHARSLALISKHPAESAQAIVADTKRCIADRIRARNEKGE